MVQHDRIRRRHDRRARDASRERGYDLHPARVGAHERNHQAHSSSRQRAVVRKHGTRPGDGLEEPHLHFARPQSEAGRSGAQPRRDWTSPARRTVRRSRQAATGPEVHQWLCRDIKTWWIQGQHPTLRCLGALESQELEGYANGCNERKENCTADHPAPPTVRTCRVPRAHPVDVARTFDVHISRLTAPSEWLARKQQ